MAESNANQMCAERDVAVRDLRAERSEHEACRLQLISAQAALQRVRADSVDTVATEGVRLTLALDELRRADRLAGVIHRSLNDAVRGASEVAGVASGIAFQHSAPMRKVAYVPSASQPSATELPPPPGSAICTTRPTPLTRQSPPPTTSSNSSSLARHAHHRLSPTFETRAAEHLSPERSTPAFGRSHVGAAADDGLGELSSRRMTLAAAGATSADYGDDAGLDVRGECATVTSFAEASERLGWLRSDSHHERLRRLRDKYGYEHESGE